MDEFLKLFGNITISSVIVIILAFGFLWKVYAQVKKYIIDRYKKDEEKDKEIRKIMEQVRLYPQWRQQSMEIQKHFTDTITGLQERMETMENDIRKRERSKLRDRLLQSYRYYTSPEKNPMQAWSKMESDAFWEMFGDYESVGGDGHMHTVVQPAMRLLEVIPMEAEERLSELMHSRK